MTRIYGMDAVEAKTLDDSVELNKFNDPIDCEEFDITIERAEEIIRDDQNLIYADIED